MLRFIVGCSLFALALGQNGNTRVPVRFCDPGTSEFSCSQLVQELKDDLVLDNGALKFATEAISNSVAYGFLQCVRAHSNLECLDLIQRGQADVMRLNAEGLFGLSQSGQYNGLLPVAAGLTSEASCPPDQECHQYAREYAVAVVRQDSAIQQLSDLRDKKACFGAVGSTSGWILPIYNLLSNWTGNDPFNPLILNTARVVKSPELSISDRIKRDTGRGMWSNVSRGSIPHQSGLVGTKVWDTMSRFRCPVDLTVANDVFPSSCAPGKWPADSSFAAGFDERLCRNCQGKNASCAANVPANAALECLRTGRGDVAFVSSKEIEKLRQNGDRADLPYAALCSVGRRELQSYPFCNWGSVPEDVYIANKNPAQFRPSVYGQYVRRLYGHARTRLTHYKALPFLADTSIVAEVKRLDELGSSPGSFISSTQYLRLEGTKKVFYDAMEKGFPVCPLKDTMRLCVLSKEEQKKCYLMQIAFRAASLPKSLECIVGYSPENCVRMINSSQADLSWIDSHLADHFDQSGRIQPIMKATSSAQPDYAVAVTMRSGSLHKLKDLGLNIASSHVSVCSAGTDSFAGWEAPNAVLKQLGIIPATQCRLTETWAKMFRSSCIPGATNATVTLGRNSSDPIDAKAVADLCHTCGGSSASTGRCLTPAQASDPAHEQYDPYYGDVGALRCLVRRKGQVAFIRSSAIETMVALKGLEDQDFRSILLSDFYLLCGDGLSRRPYSRSAASSCNLGRVPEKWLVARSNADAQQLVRWQDLWLMASNRARKNHDWMRTYIRLTPGRTDHLLDLIFANTTTGLERFPVTNTSDTYFHNIIYENWNSPFQCSSASSPFSSLLSLSLASLILKRLS